MRTLQKFIMCALMALFGHEIYLVGFCDVELNKDIAMVALMFAFLLLAERLFIWITIEHIQRILAKQKMENND